MFVCCSFTRDKAALDCCCGGLLAMVVVEVDGDDGGGGLGSVVVVEGRRVRDSHLKLREAKEAMDHGLRVGR